MTLYINMNKQGPTNPTYEQSVATVGRESLLLHSETYGRTYSGLFFSLDKRPEMLPRQAISSLTKDPLVMIGQ